ncbi:MAG: hypothetical protein ACYC8T_25750 [Myxococcaceae bacterium]
MTASPLLPLSTRALWAAALLSLGLFAGCRDEGAKHYRAGYSRYQELVTAGRAPTDPAFDEVLRELAQVPPGSKEHANAQALKDRIGRARAPRLERPLVTPYGSFAEDPEVGQKRAECEGLARQLGAAPAAEQQRLRVKVLRCQTEQHEIEELRHSRGHVHN